MARSFRIHALLYRLCGWFFIEDLFSTSESVSPRVVWKSWYTLYSAGCLALLLWIEQAVFVALIHDLAQPEARFKNGLRLVIRTILFVRMNVNFICTLLGSARLVNFYERAAAFEKQTGVLPCDCCAPRRFFWSDIQRGCLCFLYCTVLTLTDAHYDPSERPSSVAYDPLVLTYAWAKTLLSQFLYFNYDSIYAVSLRSSFQVLSEYLGKQLNILKGCTDSKPLGSADHTDIAEHVENVRITFSAVRQLKEEINDIWRWPLVVSSLCILVLPCLCVHEACQEDFFSDSRYGMVLYAIYTAYELATLAYVSQSLINKVQYLLESVDAEDMALKGADFFHLNMSSLVSMGATVITYAVIVLQTSRAIDK